MYKFLRLLNKNFKLQAVSACCCSNTSKPPPATPQMPKQLTNQTDLTIKEVSETLTESKPNELQWRTPWHQKEGQHYSMLRTFYTEDNNSQFMKFIQQPVDLRLKTLKKWWTKRVERRDIIMQQYIPERNQILGNELAAAHFLVYRGGSVKFFSDDKWIKANDYGDYTLPKFYQKDMYLQGIDCLDMNLYYEGLSNLRDLKQVEWLSLNGCEKLDDWALDRIGNLFSETLLYLDLRNMPLITHRGLGALWKMNALKILYIDDIFASSEFEMTCLMLQEIKPDLDIRIQ